MIDCQRAMRWHYPLDTFVINRRRQKWLWLDIAGEWLYAEVAGRIVRWPLKSGEAIPGDMACQNAVTPCPK
jgi:hypothetical protein